MSTETTQNLESIDPETALEMYLREREGEIRNSTYRAHRKRLRHFVVWCEENDVSDLNGLTGRDLYEYRLWREEIGDINTVTLKSNLTTLRVFVKFLERIDGVAEGLHRRVSLPDMGQDENVRNEMLSEEEAERLLAYLNKFHYASKRHVMVGILWNTAMRISSLHSLDIDDILLDKNALQLEHRPETGTTLKNGDSANRLVALPASLIEIIEDYIEINHPGTKDEYGREPLIASQEGRMLKNNIRRTIYYSTRPCFYTDKCPHKEDIESCDYTNWSTARECPSSTHPHALRRGSITSRLLDDVQKAIISDRADVGVDTLDKHYNKMTPEEKMENRRDALGFD
jgi:site-specific recombinase XerD